MGIDRFVIFIISLFTFMILFEYGSVKNNMRFDVRSKDACLITVNDFLSIFYKSIHCKNLTSVIALLKNVFLLCVHDRETAYFMKYQ